MATIIIIFLPIIAGCLILIMFQIEKLTDFLIEKMSSRYVSDIPPLGYTDDDGNTDIKKHIPINTTPESVKNKIIPSDKFQKILIFDDEVTFRKFYQIQFEKCGFQVKTYEHPPQNLIEEVVKENPDLIHMDIIMPEMNGFTATKLLKSDPRTKNIPIFGMSNMGNAETMENAIKTGMEKYFVTLRTNPTEYAQLVKEYLDLKAKKKN